MQRHKIVGKASVGVLLFLPLVAVGIALALMLSLGNQGTPTAQADTSVSIDMSITATGPGTDCTTKGPGECFYPVNSSFNLSLDINDVTAVAVLAGGYSLAQMLVIADGTNVTGPEPGNTKDLSVNGICPIPATARDPAGNTDASFMSCNAPFGGSGTEVIFGTAGNPTQLGTATFNCDQVGIGVIALINDPNNPTGNSAVGDSAGQPHLDKTGDELLIINCTPPDGAININVVDAESQSKKLAGSCWLVSVSRLVGSPPNLINKPVDVVSDNQSNPICDANGPIKADLSDKDQSNGNISILISGQNRLEFGDDWHFQQVLAGESSVNTKITYNVDPTKYTCTLSGLFKKAPPQDDVVACDEADPFVVKNVRKDALLTVTFAAKPGLDANLLTGLCVEINDGIDQLNKNKVCDGGPQDQNPADRVLSTLLTVNNPGLLQKGLYSIVAQTEKDTVNSFHLDPDQQPGNGDAKRACDTLVNQKCDITYSYASQNAFLDVEFFEVNRKNDRFQGFPGGCVGISPNAGKAQKACDDDNDSIISQVRIGLGEQTVTAQPPKGFESKTAPQICNVPAGAKCSLEIEIVYVGVPAVNSMNGTPQLVWLTNQNPNTCNASADKASKLTFGTSEPQTRIPKETIVDKTGLIIPDKTAQVVAGVDVSFLLKDSLNGNISCIEVEAGSYWNNSSCTITPSSDKQRVDIFCTTTKPNIGTLNPSLLKDMFNITVRVAPVVYSLFTANQDNGTMVQVLAMNCNLTDQLGHPIPNEKCPDGDITIRQLEGDVNRDCVVNAVDQQLLAFRWGTDISSDLFSQTYDLVDTGFPEINIKDVQFVFGRHGSECNNQNALQVSGTPNPPQPALTKK